MDLVRGFNPDISQGFVRPQVLVILYATMHTQIESSISIKVFSQFSFLHLECKQSKTECNNAYL